MRDLFDLAEGLLTNEDMLLDSLLALRMCSPRCVNFLPTILSLLGSVRSGDSLALLPVGGLARCDRYDASGS